MASEIYNVQFPGGKRVDVQAGEFLIKTDQSVQHGGDATAPEPFTLFLASMATCAGIYALGFCQKRELATDGLDLRMICERDEKGVMVTKMTLQLTLPKGFPEKYRDGVVRAMDLCTVKKHLTNAPEFVIELE